VVESARGGQRHEEKREDTAVNVGKHMGSQPNKKERDRGR